MINVEYSHNNSGGRDWLSPADWQALENEGWELYWNPFLKKNTGASKRFASFEEGIDEWTRITHQYAGAHGCSCCGPPHNFSGKDELTGDYRYNDHDPDPWGEDYW